VLSWTPRAFLFPNFLSDEECDRFIELASAKLKPSLVVLTKQDIEAGNLQENVRTSQGTFLDEHEDAQGVLRRVEQRIAQVTGIPEENGEAYNVLRYDLGQHYYSHHDFFDPKRYGPGQNKGIGNRLATVLLYLTDVEEGGETVLPLASTPGDSSWNERRTVKDFHERCDLGLRVRPRPSAMAARNRHGGGTLSPSSSPSLTSPHGACELALGRGLTLGAHGR